MSLPYRRSVRFSKSHYNKGFYFVTICTRDRIHCFGDIVDGVMHLDELGEFVTQVLQTIREHNRYAECTLFVVMPNHIHAIFAVDLKNVPTAHFVGARHASPAITEEDYIQRVSRSKGLLSVVVGNFKSAITHFANIHNIGFAWQRSYHEHIIRDTDDFNRIAEYIRMNPLRWAEDEYNKP